MGDRDVVVVLGEEPHYQWKKFTNEVVEALNTLGVKRAITLGAFIGQVAHTLPVPLVGSANSGNLGGIRSSSLEQSNVDLATQFVKMIVSQRAFQANTRTVSVTNELMANLVNLGA